VRSAGGIDSGRLVACDAPTRLLAAIGESVLELRLDEPARLVAALRDRSVPDDDVLVIGGTVTVALRHVAATQVLELAAARAIAVRSATTRPPNLDDVYLRLTGGRITGPGE
jgi:ABC-type multidrug transport system ATPase subunit